MSFLGIFSSKPKLEPEPGPKPKSEPEQLKPEKKWERRGAVTSKDVMAQKRGAITSETMKKHSEPGRQHSGPGQKQRNAIISLQIPKTEEIPVKPEEIRVTTINACFGCMASNENSKNDETAKFLAELCYNEKIKTGENVCLNNIVRIIDQSNPDILGIQEVESLDEIIQKSEKLSNYYLVKNILTKKKKEGANLNVELATFFNPEKFKLECVLCGNLDTSTEDTDLRPYQILFLTCINKENKDKKLIVVNLHNGKIVNKRKTGENKLNPCFSKEGLEGTFSNVIDLSLGYIPSIGRRELIINQTDEKTNLSSIIQLFNGELIVLGDFNDNANKYPDPITHENFRQDKFFEGFSPFKKSKYPNLNNLSVKQEDPEKTCCVGRTKEELTYKNGKGHSYQGDYILNSKNLIVIDSPKSNPSQPVQSSDHLIISGSFIFKNPYISIKNVFGDEGNMIESEEEFKRKYLIYKRKYLELKYKK
jgi:hypothetical protein